MRRLAVLLVAVLGLGLIFLAFGLAPLADRRMNRVIDTGLAPPSEQAARLHATLLVADLHADLLLWPRSVLERSSHGHVDLPRLVEGRVGLQVFSSVTKSPKGLNYERNDSTTDDITLLAIASRWPARTWRSRLERALYQAEKLRDAVRRSEGRMVAVLSSADLARFLASRAAAPDRVAALLAIEGLHASEGKRENLERLYRAGFRMMGLTHFFDNEVGGSSAGMRKGGLTDFGRETVRWMEDRRVIVDLAHASAEVVDEVLAMATRPVVVSHTGVAGTCPGPRNLSDEQVHRIGNVRGVIGIGFWEGAVCGLSPDTVAQAIRYAVRLAGIDHVGLGSDFDGSTATAFDTSKLVHLTDALVRAGFSDSEVRKIMGGNVVRLLMEGLPPR